MHSDFYENSSDVIISLREEVSRLRRAVDLDEVNTLKKLVLLILDECDELTGKVEQLEAAQPKWISVEERLPENCVEVLLYYKKGYMSMGYWDDDLCEWDGMTDEKIVRPDYWMSLPEEPKEDT